MPEFKKDRKCKAPEADQLCSGDVCASECEYNLPGITEGLLAVQQMTTVRGRAGQES